jgi:hypothetical protein
MTDHDPAGDRARSLAALADALERLRFDLSGRGAAELRNERDRVARLLRGVGTRAADPDAPLLVVVGGGSGAGKSTTVNSLAGRRVAAAGVVRPTTRVATVICHPHDEAVFASERILPGLVRVDATKAAQVAGERTLLLATSEALPPGLAVLDTPDVDSIAHANRWLAERALDAADVWVWLATARTYADEVGMTYLRRAARRQALVSVAITQIPADQSDELLADATRLLTAEGVHVERLFAIQHADVVDDRLPAGAVGDLEAWLSTLAPIERRRAVRERALQGLVAAIPTELARLDAAVTREREHADRLAAMVDERFEEIAPALDAELEAGLSLRAEVLEGWQRLVGGNELLLKVQTTATQLGGLVRDRLGLGAAGRAGQVQAEVGDELVRILDRLLERATVTTRRDLEADRVGLELLEQHPRLRASPSDRRSALRATIDAWQAATTALIDEVGTPRKVQARRASIAINSLATSAILVLFTVSGGLTAGEVGIAAGAAATSQWLLTKLLGEHNVRRLLEEMRADLHRRVAHLAAAERRPFDDAIGSARPPGEAVEALRDALGGLP